MTTKNLKQAIEEQATSLIHSDDFVEKQIGYALQRIINRVDELEDKDHRDLIEAAKGDLNDE